MAVQERPPRGLQEGLLALLAHSDEHCEWIVEHAPPELFEGDYRVIATRCANYIKQHKRAPKAHTPDLLADILEDKGNRKAATYRHVLVMMYETVKDVDWDFVVGEVTKFRETQRLKDNVIAQAEALERGDLDRHRQLIADAQDTPPGVLPAEAKHSWDSPDHSLLDERRGDLPAFPLESLKPGELQAWAEQAAAGSGTTVDHVVVPMLGIASGLIGGARCVQAGPTWVEPATLWAVLVAASGEGKTPALNATLQELEAIESEHRSVVDSLRREHERVAARATMAEQEWKAKVKEAVKARKEPPEKPEAADDPGDFVPPRLFTTDPTVEALARLLQARPSGLMLIDDELARLFMNMSRYSQGQDNEFWLKTWDGLPFHQDRIGRRPIDLERLLVGLVGGFQPDKLAQSFKGPADGMYARFLFAWPMLPPYRPISNETVEDSSETVMATALNRLLTLAPLGAPVEQRTIALSEKALARFNRWREHWHRKLEQLDGREREWWAKAPAHVLRLALTLAYLEWAVASHEDEPDKILLQHIRAAVAIVNTYFWPHARAALRQVGLSERQSTARRVLRWLAAHPSDEVSRETVRRQALAQSLTADETQKVLLGWSAPVGCGRSSPASRARAGGRRCAGKSTRSSASRAARAHDARIVHGLAWRFPQFPQFPLPQKEEKRGYMFMICSE